jgi:UDP-2,3-diacylglucosamine hydrolase
LEYTTYYFASDFHLGAPNHQTSREREDRVVAWLDSIQTDAKAVFLMGDVFDFWFEYKTVIPKGFIRLQGKLAELADKGIKIYFFKGNHDMWVFDYFEKELGATIIDNEFILEDFGRRIFLHHGDGLGKGDKGYKILKNFFRSKFCQWLFARLHPNFGIGIANYWSSKSRLANSKKEGDLHLEFNKNWIKNYYQILKQDFGIFDYVIMGHRHFPVVINVEGNTKYINLGEWVNYSTYVKVDKNGISLIDFSTKQVYEA